MCSVLFVNDSGSKYTTSFQRSVQATRNRMKRGRNEIS